MFTPDEMYRFANGHNVFRTTLDEMYRSHIFFFNSQSVNVYLDYLAMAWPGIKTHGNNIRTQQPVLSRLKMTWRQLHCSSISTEVCCALCNSISTELCCALCSSISTQLCCALCSSLQLYLNSTLLCTRHSAMSRTCMKTLCVLLHN